MTRVVYDVTFSPIDPLQFGDNRRKRAGIDHEMGDRDPIPLTFYGAVGGYLIDQLNDKKHAEEFAGPIVGDVFKEFDNRGELLGVCRLNADGREYFPKPRHLLLRQKRKGFTVAGLPLPTQPEDVASSCPFDYLLDHHMVENEATEEMAVDTSLLTTVLCGKPLDKNTDAQAEPVSKFHVSEVRLGLKMDNETSTAEEHMLFRRTYRRYYQRLTTVVDGSRRWSVSGFKAWYSPIKEFNFKIPLNGIGVLGGNRGRARLSFGKLAETPLSRMKQKVKGESRQARGFIVYLLTPAVHDENGKWPTIEGMSPVAAAIGRTKHVSSWNVLENQPREVLSLIPEGSVFFYEGWPKGKSPESVIEDNWLSCLSKRYGPAGFGRVLMGVWK